MNRCPITYEECEGGQYSLKGLKRISPRLKSLKDFPYSAEDQVREAIARAAKMSIQGVQPKLSVRLNTKNEIFEVVDTGGRYIFKPQTSSYRIVDTYPRWTDLIQNCFLSDSMKTQCIDLLNKRFSKLELTSWR